ncbi:MAG: TetR/AcrR family transcriptional regulator, partial [Pseudomonadota bacterium]
MARRIEYDSTKVQQSLTDLFWQKGFAETSLADLEAASGLNRRQLYNGIGDKHAMLLKALDTFTEQAGRQFLAALESEDAGLDEIEALLRLFAAAGCSDGPHPGCMVCTVSQEEISGNDAVAGRIDAYFSRIRAAYRNALQRATERGEVMLNSASIDLRTDALFGVHVAISVLVRAGRPGDELNRMVDQALNDLRA